MNIKQAEALCGVSRQNIRFYEREGLLAPTRNPENDYREYTQSDVHALKCIRAMRMLDMPLADIRQVLAGELPLGAAAQAQQTRLKTRIDALSTALSLCETLSNSPGIDAFDADACLAQLERGGPQGYFRGWQKDYRTFAAAEHQRRFTFVPDGPVTTPAEFTAALLAYAAEQKLDLTVTREGMYPVFTLDGVEYAAERIYRRTGYRISVPLAVIVCEMTHPEAYQTVVSKRRETILRLTQMFLPGVICFAFILMLWASRAPIAFTPATVGLLLLIAALCAVGSYRYWLFHWGDHTTL